MEKKLIRSNEQRMICGVCGGIAEYFEIDPTWVRIGAAAFTLMSGVGILLYIAAALIMPKRNYPDVI